MCLGHHLASLPNAAKMLGSGVRTRPVVGRVSVKRERLVGLGEVHPAAV
ncbi:hypothetical protein JOE40_001782 [Arthrobacter sp. PvP102]|nr:hypothetical protein [Arthrobacter sp. PvP103]MBP1237273.1 hypothetical protein [Arthrobacter sp. PvP102]